MRKCSEKSSTKARQAGLLLCAALAAAPAWARVELDAGIQEQMVVQRGKPWRVSGTAADGERVRASFLGQQREARAAGGAWSFSFDVPAGAAGPAELSVGDATRKVVVGDVWLCSGQSNMALAVGRAADGEAIAQAAAGKPVYVFQVAKPLAAAQPAAGRWLPAAAPDAVARFSAVCLAFGAALQDVARAPVGLIDASLGATLIESWVSPDAMRSVALSGYARERYDKTRRQRESGGKRSRVSGIDEPSQLFDLMVRPRTGQAIRGVLWYQGEGNRSEAARYAGLLALLIRDWRAQWSDAALPFVVVQLPGFGERADFDERSAWAGVRDSQRAAVEASKDAALAVTLDLGNGAIHPPAKLPFGQRIAQSAAELVYGAPRKSAPTRLAARAEGAALRIEVGGGQACLQPKPAAGAIYLAGADRRWQRADAVVERSAIVASSPQVPLPVAARYAWADHPAAPLVSCEGVPLTPFRTDDWQ